jgi:hypothetical protein
MNNQYSKDEKLNDAISKYVASNRFFLRLEMVLWASVGVSFLTLLYFGLGTI